MSEMPLPKGILLSRIPILPEEFANHVHSQPQNTLNIVGINLVSEAMGCHYIPIGQQQNDDAELKSLRNVATGFRNYLRTMEVYTIIENTRNHAMLFYGFGVQ